MTALLPFVVLRSDPRWPAALEELRALRRGFFAIDTEFYEDPELRRAAEATERDLGKDNFDPWSTRLRCLQVGLPSGLCMVADFGPPGRFDAEPYVEFLAVLKEKCRSREVAKVGWSLGTEALILRRHQEDFPEWFGPEPWLMRRVRDGMLVSQVLWAGVAAKRARWTESGLVAQDTLSHSFAAAAGRVGVQIDKDQQQSDWGREKLTVEQLNYAALDVYLPSTYVTADGEVRAGTLGETWRRLCAAAREAGVLDAAIVECEAAPAFFECEWRGTPHDAEQCERLRAQYQRAGDELYGRVSAMLGGVPVEGDGSQQATALALTRWLRANGHPGARLFRWERKVGERTQVSHALEVEQPEKLPKPRKPTGAPKPPERKKRDTDEAFEARKRRYDEDRAIFDRRLSAYEAELHEWEAAQKAPRWRFWPEMGEAALAAYDAFKPVSDLMEARSCRSTARVLEKRQQNSWPSRDGRPATRCRYWQIAGGFDSGRGESDGAGGGTGRSSSSKPLNNQNVTTLPLGKQRSKELGLDNVRTCVRPRAGRALIVGDFSQAHMRIFAQVSQDPALLEDFRAGRDAHVRLARDFSRAANSSPPEQPEIPDAFASEKDKEAARIEWVAYTEALRVYEFSQKSFDYWCEVYQAGKAHPEYELVKSPRGPAKNSNYNYLNMGGAQKARQIAETAPEPVHLPETIEVDGDARDPWELTHELWRETYAVGYQWQRGVIRKANRAAHAFPFCDGEYGEVWSADGTRRLYLLKEWNVPKWAESPDEGRWSCKGTDALAGIMQMSEANALKIALALCEAEFDTHPEWEAYVFNIVHDEIDAECAWAHREAVAKVVHRAMNKGLRRAGVVDLPTCAPDDTWEKLIVQSWADK